MLPKGNTRLSIAADASRRGMERHLGNIPNQWFNLPTEPNAIQLICIVTIDKLMFLNQKNKETSAELSKSKERMLDLPEKISGYERFAKSEANSVKVG